MGKLASVLILLLALIHTGFAVAEIFLWRFGPVHSKVEHPVDRGGKWIPYNKPTATIVAPIVANAGIYNSFIAVGLFWSLVTRKRQNSIRRFFLYCVVAAGLFGAVTLWSWVPLVAQFGLGLAALLAVAFTKPNPPWQMGAEYPAPDEQSDIDEVLRLSALLQPTQDGKVVRGQHAKSTGGVPAKLIVHQTSPQTAFGIFREPKTYDIDIRYSNGVGRVQADWIKDARGMSFKVKDVQGQRCMASEQDPTVQDFVMINFPAFPVRDAEQYATLLALRQRLAKFPGGSKLAPILFFIPFHLKSFFNVASKLQRKSSSVLDETYWSMSAFRLGPHAVKYSVAPKHPRHDDNSASESNDDDFLIKELVKRLGHHKIVLSFRAQFQKDPYKTPVEDPTIIWDSTPIEIATIEIEQAALANEAEASEQRKKVDAMAFNTWHSIEEHRPLGSINRLRKAVYAASARARGSRG